MNTISGKIVHRETQLGIPNLLVVLYDVDPSSKPEEALAGYSGAPASNGYALNGLGDRLGSVLTTSDGSFSLTYEDIEFQLRNGNEKRPDVFLLVMAPEAPGKSSNELILFASPEVRQNAGRIESYFIELSPEQVSKAGLLVPQNGKTPDADPEEEELKTFQLKLESSQRFFDKKASILHEHIEQQHQKHAEEREYTFTANVRQELSQVPEATRASIFFVPAGESIHNQVFTNTATTLQETFNAPTKKPITTAFIYLTQAQRNDYAEFIKGDEFVLPGHIIERDILPQLFRRNSEDGSANDFLMDHPVVRLCTRITRGDPTCEADPALPKDREPGDVPRYDTPREENYTDEEQRDDPDPNNPGPIFFAPPNGSSLALAKPEDVFSWIERQMEHVTSPEGIVNFGVEPKIRAEPSDIGETISKLQFEKGPADIPAFFDFHTLQIAFKPVWSEALDESLIADANKLYDEVVGAGIRPTKFKPLKNKLGSLLDFLNNLKEQRIADPPIEVVFEFADAVNIWTKMTDNERKTLIKLARAMLGKYQDFGADDTTSAVFGVELTGGQTWLEFLQDTEGVVSPPYIGKAHLIDRGAVDAISYFRQKGQRIIDNVYERVEERNELPTELDRYQRAAQLARELEHRLKQSYSFTYFAADHVERSVNFGVLLTYRQRWDPVNYQAGELVRTIPLSPKEVRKYSKKTVVKKSRSQKEIEDNLRITKTDTSDTSRSESDIVNRALNKSSFELKTENKFDLPIGEVVKIGTTASTKQTNDAERESNQTKKDFREAVVKAAQEYKNERRVEITTDTSYEEEITESGEISNPNDELTVTYLFYELQRVFRIYERLHRMRPVIFVAQEMPAPDGIDDAWIVRHEWILKRALLDDGFLPAFVCIANIRGDRLMLDELERTVREQRKIIKDLRQNVKFYTDETGRMSRMMQAAINKEASLAEDRDFWDAIPLLGGHLDNVEGAIKGVGGLLGMGSGDDPKEAARIRGQGIKDAYERADRERRELLGRLEQETGVLNGLTKQVAEKRKDINEKEVLIAQLKHHLKDHILHYMQTIWRYEHPDQRFFRLYNTQVPYFTATPEQYNIKVKTAPAPAVPLDAVVNLDRVGDQVKTRHAVTFSPFIKIEKRTLEQVAEVDTLLGFEGNYAIFPLKNSNVLTDFMMAPYVDSEFELLDPDALGNWTLEEFDQLYCCLKKELGERFVEIEEELKKFFRQLLLDPLRQGELITIPTGSLFIEALPGAHSLLEDFKLIHRAVDAKKVQAEVRKLEMENIRYAARILSGEHDDPDVEKKIIVKGGQVPVLDS